MEEELENKLKAGKINGKTIEELLKLGFDSLEAFSLFPTEDVDKELNVQFLHRRRM
jgi:hypothetical protein